MWAKSGVIIKPRLALGMFAGKRCFSWFSCMNFEPGKPAGLLSVDLTHTNNLHITVNTNFHLN